MLSLIHEEKEGHQDGIWCVTWTKKTNLLVTGSLDQTIKCWNGDDYKLAKSFVGSHHLAVLSVASNSKGDKIASSSLDSIINIWDVENGTLLATIDPGPMEAWKLVFSTDDKYIASGTQSGNINMWEIAKPDEKRVLATEGKFVMCVAFSPNSRFIGCGTENGVLYIFEASTSRLLHKIDAHSSSTSIRSVSFSADSGTIATGSEDGMIHLYDCEHGNFIHAYTGHSSWVTAVAFSPTRKDRLVSGSTDKTIRVWDLTEKQCVHVFDSHQDQVTDIAFNETGSKFVSVSDDKSFIVYSCPI